MPKFPSRLQFHRSFFFPARTVNSRSINRTVGNVGKRAFCYKRFTCKCPAMIRCKSSSVAVISILFLHFVHPFDADDVDLDSIRREVNQPLFIHYPSYYYEIPSQFFHDSRSRRPLSGTENNFILVHQRDYKLSNEFETQESITMQRENFR